MSEETIIKIESVIDYIETHLNEKLTLDTIAAAIHYSKYHLSRLFLDTVGLHINEYIKRRQLTEAAKLLIFSEKPIIDIALLCGYQSQQAFSSAFKSMYKAPPAEYRATHSFYPLQLRFTLEKNYSHPLFSIDHIRLANETDIPAWMNLMHLVIDGYPEMNEEDYLTQLKIGISEQRALVLKDDALLIGAMLFNRHTGSIDYWGVHPQYRNAGIHKLFIDALLHTYLPNQDISMTTYRAGDKADTGHRALLYTLGFAERELLVEYGYPTQKFVLSSKQEGNAHD
ncbi:MAG: AraC family transcriptional regulator [Peptococcaceae bacterium]|nr:AraC family transcriptional regulator [Peptococcaceae bacterium]